MKQNLRTDLNYTSFEGQEVLNLLPIANKERVAALVDLSVLQRVIGSLDTVDLYTMKSRFMDKVQRIQTLPDYLDLLQEEIAFHNTINIIRTVEVKKFEASLEED